MEVTTANGKLVPKASIGRIVHFTHTADNEGALKKSPAIITQVWSDECVNLCVFVDGWGSVLPVTSVPLKTDTNKGTGFYFEWPERV